MKKINRILCAVDLSQHSERVAAYAKTFAVALGAEVVVVYVAPELTQYVGVHVPSNSLEASIKEIIDGAKDGMKDFIKKAFDGCKATGIVTHGYAAEKIIETANEEKADLIIMGTHGRKGLDLFLFGSVAERVVKSADMPVLTVRPGPFVAPA